MKKVIFILIIIIGAYYKYKPVEESPTSTQLAQSPDISQVASGKLSGFTPVYMPQGARKNEVLILTPIHCTSEEVQVGINLESAIKNQGIPVKRKSGFLIETSNISNQEKELIDQTVSLFKTAKPPIVFINGYGKGSPTVSEVINAFHATE